MFYNYFKDEGSEYDECTARGACSIAPKISSLQEVLLIFLRHIAYYALKLEKLGEDIFQIGENITESLATLISTTDYTDEQLLGLVAKQYAYLIKTKRKYFELCKSNGVSCTELKPEPDITPQMTLSAIISQGERLYLSKYNKKSVTERNMYEILLAMLKSVSANLSHLKEFQVSSKEAQIDVLTGLNILNDSKFSRRKVKDIIKKLAKTDEIIISKTSEEQIKRYGNLSLTKVSHTAYPGKSILVSGGSLGELLALLNAVKNSEIDIYTHGDLLIAHAFEKFKGFKQLKGHYGTCLENCILDFATFPGAILLTKNSSQNLEYLYRGRLFSTELFKPKGVIQIVNNNFKPLIKSALEAKGFAKELKRECEEVGYAKDELLQQLLKIADKFNNKEIEHLIIIGISNYTKQQEVYFKNLLKNLPEKSYVISFSYSFGYSNVLKLNLVNNLPLVYSVMGELFSHIDITSGKISFFLTKCDAGSISKLISLKNNGAKNVFLYQCSPNVINPSVLSTLQKAYGIKSTTTPEKDAENI